MSIALVGSVRSKSPIVRASTALAFACGVALVTGAATAQSFTGLGVLPGDGIESKSRCVSDNGSVVVGLGLIPPDNSTPTTGQQSRRGLRSVGHQSPGTAGRRVGIHYVASVHSPCHVFLDSTLGILPATVWLDQPSWFHRTRQLGRRRPRGMSRATRPGTSSTQSLGVRPRRHL